MMVMMVVHPTDQIFHQPIIISLLWNRKEQGMTSNYNTIHSFSEVVQVSSKKRSETYSPSKVAEHVFSVAFCTQHLFIENIFKPLVTSLPTNATTHTASIIFPLLIQ